MLLFLGTTATHADTSVQIGTGLNTLTQIQGAWKNACHRTGIKASEGFRQDYLNVKFTHIELVAKIYNDENCTQPLTQRPAKYRFTLGDEVILPSRETAFLLKLEEESDPADAWALSIHNILQYRVGQLRLGRESLLGPSSSQLTTLDTELTFSRR